MTKTTKIILNQWIKRVEKKEITKPVKNDFFDYAGMWKDENIAQEELRASARERNNNINNISLTVIQYSHRHL